MSTGDETVTIGRKDWEAVLARLAAVEGALDRPSEAAGPPPPPGPVASTRPVSRRRALAGFAGAAAAGIVVATAARAQPAAAADTDALLIGSATNAGTKPTRLAVTHTSGPTSTPPAFGFGVVDDSLGSLPPGYTPTLLAHAKGASFSTAVLALAEGAHYGVVAHSEQGSGVIAVSDAGLGMGAATTSPSSAALEVHDAGGPGAITVFATQNHLWLRSGPSAAPTSRSTFGAMGTLVAQDDGTLWYCTASGTPGTWRALTANTAAGSFHPLPVPVRVYDSRPSLPPAVGPKAPLAANTARTLDLTANSSGVPRGATAAVVSCLLVNASTGNGNFTIWSNAASQPAANTLVWGGSAGRFTTTAVTTLDANAKVKVQANLATDLVLDVVGYYR